MTYKDVKKKSITQRIKKSGWDLAIAQADKKIAVLKNAKAAFERYKERGEPFPAGEDKAVLGQDSDL